MLQSKIYNDAASHIMETQDWLTNYADAKIRSRLAPLDATDAGSLVAIAFVHVSRSHATGQITLPAPLVVILIVLVVVRRMLAIHRTVGRKGSGTTRQRHKDSHAVSRGGQHDGTILNGSSRTEAQLV